jgi:uncharacterized protein (TIGR02246 family)
MRRKLAALASAPLLWLCLSGCSQPATETSVAPDTRAADEAAIRAASAAWNAAAQAKDVEKAVSFYSDDAMMFPEKSPLVKGKDDIRKTWRDMLALPGPGLSFQTTGVTVARSGELAYEYGTFDFAVSDKKGTITDEKGKFVVVWKKQPSGEWKAAIDIFNQDK